MIMDRVLLPWISAGVAFSAILLTACHVATTSESMGADTTAFLLGAAGFVVVNALTVLYVSTYLPQRQIVRKAPPGNV